jgi:hypothetical protein
MRSNIKIAVLVVLAALLISACAPGPNPAVDAGPDPAGFWLGLWQGFIAPITFFISLFTDNVNIYEVNNNGNWYDFGYVIGAGLLLSGGIFGRSRKKY